jgi:hypothetical protein
MREIRTSGLMSGEGKRIGQTTPRLSSTLQREPVKSMDSVVTGHLDGLSD